MTSEDKIKKATKLLEEKLFEVMQEINQGQPAVRNLSYGELLIVINNLQSKWLERNLHIEQVNQQFNNNEEDEK